MDERRLGVALLAVAAVGYVGGVVVAYPGRSFSITLAMAGVALVALGRADG